MKARGLVAGVVGLCGMAQAAFVTIGNAGNAADTTGYGKVDYTYRISDHEVTIAEFQRAVGAGSGNENYWNDGTRTVGTNAPASYVTLCEAAKYCNWLTSGNVNNGAYTINILTLESVDRAAAIATYGVIYVLPTEDEWYKAAYFKPDASGYSLYANGTDTIPTWGTTNGWNYKNGTLVCAGTWETEFGGIEQNGTYDMMGNVREWVENTSGAVRGGGYYDGENLLRSTTRLTPGVYGDANFGFRVVAIPEPATALSLVLGGLLITGYRRIRKTYGL